MGWSNNLRREPNFCSQRVMQSSISLILKPISASTFAGGNPRGRATGGASLPEGKYPNATTTQVRARCLQVRFVVKGLPAAATRSNPFNVPV